MAIKVNQKKASQLLGVSPITIKRWVDAGKLRCIKVGERKLTYDVSDLETMRQVINPLTPMGGGNNNG
jgi:excisionase family DNA binding protein